MDSIMNYGRVTSSSQKENDIVFYATRYSGETNLIHLIFLEKLFKGEPIQLKGPIKNIFLKCVSKFNH